MCKNLLNNLIIPAYELCIKASHCFNLMESRGLISVTENGLYFKGKNISSKML